MKNIILFLFVFLLNSPLSFTQPLCEIYENTPIDVTISNGQASDWSGYDFNGEHVLLQGPFLLDSDINFNGAIIRIGLNGMFISQNQRTVTFTNCKVYAECGENYTFLIFESEERGTSIVVKNSIFEDMLELFHVKYPLNIDITNSHFKGSEEHNFGHVLHINDFDPIVDPDQKFRFEGNTLDISSGVWLHNVSKLSIVNNTFKNCNYTGIALEASSSKIDVRRNTFINCEVGIDAKFTTYNDYFIGASNRFYNVKTGFNFPIPIANSYLSDNTLINNTTSCNSFLNGLNGNYYLLNNSIDDNNVSNSVKYGFYLNGQGSTYAQFNSYNSTAGSYMFNIAGKDNFTATENTSDGGRLYLKGINTLDLYDNEVDANNHKFSYRTDMSNGRFCNNLGKNALKVFSFRGNCMNTEFANNEFGDPFTISPTTGLFVDDVIGQQFHKANLWQSVFTTEGATNTSSNFIFSLVTVNDDPLQGGNSKFIPANNSYSPTNWFAFDYTTSSFSNCLSSNISDPGNPKNHITYVDLEVIRDNYNTSSLSNWLAVRNVIKKLNENPSLLNDTEVNTWYQTQQGTAVNAVAEIEVELSDYYGNEQEVNDIRSSLGDYIILSDSLSQIDTSHTSYQPLTDTIDQILNQIATIQNTIHTRKSAIVSNVNSLLPTIISTSNEYEILFKDVYEIYIKYLNDRDYTLTANEIIIITEAANLCPLTFGTSIYTARTLASYYNIMYDEENCSEIRTRKNNKQDFNANEINIYPNPSSHIINIETEHPVNEIRLYDANLNLVLTSDQTTIEIEHLSSGIYICKIMNNANIIGRKKIVIIK